MLEVSVDLQTVTVMEGLTEDAVYARLHEGEWVVGGWVAGRGCSTMQSEDCFSEGWTLRPGWARTGTVLACSQHDLLVPCCVKECGPSHATLLCAGGLAPPLFLHVPAASSSADRRLKESTFEREWEQRVAATFKSQVGRL